MWNRAAQVGAAFAMFMVSTVATAQPAGAPLAVHSRRTAISPALPAIGPNNRDWMVAHFINVGQGQAILLEFSCGLVLVDTGGGQVPGINWVQRFTAYVDRVLDRRRDLNDTIDVVFITHPHVDHTLGTTGMGQGTRYRVNRLVTNAETRGSGFDELRPFLSLAQTRGIHQPVSTSDIPAAGLTDQRIDPLNCRGTDPDIRVLWGSSNRWRDNGNNHSLVVRVAFGESSFLIVGDLEEDAQPAMLRQFAQNRELFDVDVYAVGHHGSRNGTSEDLVDAMRPEIAVMSAGNPANREPRFAAYNFGHPNLIAIDRLRDPTNGVSMVRPSRTVPVGISGLVPARRNPPRPAIPPVYRDETISHAIFSTGWDGNVVIFASRTGEKRVVID